MNNENLKPVEKLTPFTKMIMTIGTLPSSFYASMSYYESMVWLYEYLKNEVIPAVNNNGEAVEELQAKFTLLKTYIDEYFDNLDVQEEINNKLDEMAVSGELEDIIKSYVDPLYQGYVNEINDTITNQNNRISNIENQVTSVASGSPIPVSSTDAMTDTSRVYVNTTDGKWYYYDGDSWEIGGTYQSTEIADGSVTFNNLESELQAGFKQENDTTNITRTTQKILKKNGDIQDTNISFSVYNISVNPDETYKLHIYFPTSTYLGDYDIAIGFFNNTTLISYLGSSDLTITNNYYDLNLDIPNGVNKIVINTPNVTSGNLTANKSYILKVKDYSVKNVNKSQLSLDLQTLFYDQYSEVDLPEPFIQNAYFNNSGIIYSYSNVNIYALTVNPGEKYKISGYQLFANPLLAYSGENFKQTITLSGNDYVLNNMIDFIISETSSYHYVDYTFTIPEYCKKIYISKAINDPLKLEKVTSYKIKIEDVIQNYNKVGFSTWYAIGDSITEVNFRALHNYLYWIKEDMPDLTIINKGLSGTGYMSGSNTFIERLDSINSYDLSNTIITVMGSINDVGKTLGEMGDTTTDTLYGSMYQFFNTLFTKFNGVRIGCISPINWKYSENSNAFTNYRQALKDTCEYFNVPYLDIHDITNLRPNNDDFLEEYYTADGVGNNHELDTGGVHPNSNGHKLFYARIKEFINKL